MKKQQEKYRGCCRGNERETLLPCPISVGSGRRVQASRERGAEGTEAKHHYPISVQEMGRREQKKYDLDWRGRLAVRCDRAGGGEASVG
jgi:hypothetical protein